jgi:hypothetical protein
MASSSRFLALPPEIRLAVYDLFLADHQRVRADVQPSNAHILLLRTCRLVNDEAGALFRQYISLRHELQIHAFIRRLRLNDDYEDRVLWADVANDGRFALDHHTGQVSCPHRLKTVRHRLCAPLDLGG